MRHPTMTTTPPDVPPQVTDRPIFKPLSPTENDEFLRKQAEFEAAYRCTGDPLALEAALRHAWWSRQTVPGRLVSEIGNTLIRLRTDEEAERYRDRMRHVRRFTVVRNLRRKGNTKDSALDKAVEFLVDEPAAASRRTIENSYDVVKRDLQRRGRESEFFYFIADDDQRDLTSYAPYSLTE
jgi:hypothetical protein